MKTLIAISLALVGCAADAELDDTDIDFTTLDGKADFSSQMKIADSLTYGHGTDVSSTGTPRYTAVKFVGHAGDAIQASAAAGCGDYTSVWVLSPSFTPIASDGVGSCDGETGFRGSGTGRVELFHDGTYYVVFRDHDKQYPDADFDVWLDGVKAANRKGVGETCQDGAYSLDCAQDLSCTCTTSACIKQTCQTK